MDANVTIFGKMIYLGFLEREAAFSSNRIVMFARVRYPFKIWFRVSSSTIIPHIDSRKWSSWYQISEQENRYCLIYDLILVMAGRSLANEIFNMTFRKSTHGSPRETRRDLVFRRSHVLLHVRSRLFFLKFSLNGILYRGLCDYSCSSMIRTRVSAKCIALWVKAFAVNAWLSRPQHSCTDPCIKNTWSLVSYG